MAETRIAGKTDAVIVAQPGYLKGFAETVEATPLDAWKAYLKYHVIASAAPYLSKPFADENFAFEGGVLSGTPVELPRWKRGVGVVESTMGQGLGKLYVAKYFPPENKARMDEMVRNILAAYRQSIDNLDWMGLETKKQAQAKLAKFDPKIAYPSKWRDYTSLTVKKDDLIGNVMRARRYEYNRNLAKLGRPIDRTEWGMTPQTVNAYYNSRRNEIVFPAAILQPPFFDPKADDATNYGSIGAVIGHEISHGFDDSGSQSDGDGQLRDWWTADDRARFNAKTKTLIAQYDAFEPVPGYHVNGALTLGENIADNSGIAIAYKAYQISLHGKPSPVIDGKTGEQRFYIGFATIYRVKIREAQAIRQVKSDTHSPGEFRANGTLRNQEPFYQAFGVKPGDGMYLPPEQRVTIW
jgi:putative endopeptidase